MGMISKCRIMMRRMITKLMRVVNNINLNAIQRHKNIKSNKEKKRRMDRKNKP